MNSDTSSPGRWFAEEWTTLLGNVLEAMGGERPRLELNGAPPGATWATVAQEEGRQDAILWWEQAFPLPGDPAVWIGAPQNAWSQMAGKVLGAAGLADLSEAHETYLEILQQSLAELARAVAERWSIAIPPAGREAPQPAADGELYLVDVAYPDAAAGRLLLLVAGTPAEPTPAPEPSQVAAQASPANSNSKTFDLLMDVELPVSVSFGHVQIPLKDVLKLTAGSIIELNRTVDEPVEVIVNNCVIARGEVVVVEGNYGVRIHQIMSRQQRLESLP